jgi:hypothetical protein
VRIRILDQAKLDLTDGFEFYEEREENLGHYFLDTLYSDIDSLALYGGIHPVRHGFHGRFRSGFLTPFTIRSPKTSFPFMQCSIAGPIQNRFKSEWNRSEPDDGPNEEFAVAQSS